MSATRSARQLALRRPDRRRQCHIDLAVGPTAWWDPAARTVTCLECVRALGSVAPPEPVPVDPGQPGASALREYERRRDARDRHAREKLGAVGGLAAKVIDEPASTRAWQQGGNGEVRVGARLEKLLAGTGVRLLHDRRVPRHGHSNIDHIAIGPGGVTVIDTKTHRGKIRRDWCGGLFVDRRTILRINGRDQTKLITGVEKQIGYVRAALAKLDTNVSIDVAGALCFPTSTASHCSGGSKFAGFLSMARSRSRTSRRGRAHWTAPPWTKAGVTSPVISRRPGRAISLLRFEPVDFPRCRGRRASPKVAAFVAARVHRCTSSPATSRPAATRFSSAIFRGHPLDLPPCMPSVR